MTNAVALSGKLVEIYDMTEGVKMAMLECDEEIIYIYWEESSFQDNDLEGCYISLLGSLRHIRYRKPDKQTTRRILAVCVEEMERYE